MVNPSPEGVLRQITTNDLSVGRSIRRCILFRHSNIPLFVVGGADAVRMKDEHGEVCPANWREGRKTICGVPIVKLDHFAAVDGRHESGKANSQKVRVRRPKPTCPWRSEVAPIRSHLSHYMKDMDDHIH